MEIKNIEDYFTPNAWKLISDYERNRYKNLLDNYEVMKSAGIMAKMPEFMTYNNRKRKRNQARDNGSKDLFQAPLRVSRDQRTKIKLLGVTPAPKPKNRNIEEVGESIVAEMQPNSKPADDIGAAISSRKQFAQVALKSTYDLMKIVKNGEKSAKEEVTGYACNVCGSLFSSSSAMEAHRKTHPHMQPDRRYKCPRCTYSTQRKDSLHRHLLTHTGERPHACQHCGKGFTQKSSLTVHLRLHTGEKPFQCEVCGRAFNVSGNLISHEKTHTGDKCYRCTTCGKDFLKASHLKAHERTHTLQRPYKCSQCNYRATRAAHLRRHVVSKHTRDFRHTCAECGKGFFAPCRLKEHFEKAHKKKQEEMN